MKVDQSLMISVERFIFKCCSLYHILNTEQNKLGLQCIRRCALISFFFFFINLSNRTFPMFWIVVDIKQYVLTLILPKRSLKVYGNRLVS